MFQERTCERRPLIVLAIVQDYCARTHTQIGCEGEARGVRRGGGVREERAVGQKDKYITGRGEGKKVPGAGVGGEGG